MKIPVQEQLPSPQTVHCNVHRKRTVLDGIGILVQVQQAIGPAVSRDHDIDVQIPKRVSNTFLRCGYAP